MQRSLTISKRAGVVVLAALALMLFAVPSFAFDLNKSTNGVVISRSDVDTANATIKVYYDYKGGDSLASWSTTYQPGVLTSYNKNYTACILYNTGESVEIPLPSASRFVCIDITDTIKEKTFAVVNEPMFVSVVNTRAVEVTFTPVASSESTVSVVGTLPVSVASMGSVDGQGISLLLGAGAFALGLVFHKAGEGAA